MVYDVRKFWFPQTLFYNKLLSFLFSYKNKELINALLLNTSKSYMSQEKLLNPNLIDYSLPPTYTHIYSIILVTHESVQIVLP